MRTRKRRTLLTLCAAMVLLGGCGYVSNSNVYHIYADTNNVYLTIDEEPSHTGGQALWGMYCHWNWDCFVRQIVTPDATVQQAGYKGITGETKICLPFTSICSASFKNADLFTVLMYSNVPTAKKAWLLAAGDDAAQPTTCVKTSFDQPVRYSNWPDSVVWYINHAGNNQCPVVTYGGGGGGSW